MKVENMISAKGNTIANQFVITDGTKTVFQSYKSVIAVNDNGQVTLDSHYWDYSVTTGKYRNIFLNETKKDTIKKINSGEYKLADLN